MQRYTIFCFSAWAMVAGLISGSHLAHAQDQQAEKVRTIDPAKVDEDFAFQGEYVGEVDGKKFGAQVVALGKGVFQAYLFSGGLPGDGWDGKEKVEVPAQGKRNGNRVEFGGSPKGGMLIEEGILTIHNADDNKIGELEKIVRQSKTLGQMPPANAVVLFDGTSVENWKDGKLSEEGLLMQGTTSKQEFGSHKLHLEFLLPYMPEDRGQGRGNSGLYVQGRYEVQMLDSFGLEGKMNECGGLYSVKACDLNMCYPPLSWQTYDIEFTAAKYEDGKLVANPRMTVYHNGVKIHDDVELPGERNTTAAPKPAGPGKGPVYLQNHGNPVRYRNIWVVEK